MTVGHRLSTRHPPAQPSATHLGLRPPRLLCLLQTGRRLGAYRAFYSCPFPAGLAAVALVAAPPAAGWRPRWPTQGPPRQPQAPKQRQRSATGWPLSRAAAPPAVPYWRARRLLAAGLRLLVGSLAAAVAAAAAGPQRPPLGLRCCSCWRHGAAGSLPRLSARPRQPAGAWLCPTTPPAACSRRLRHASGVQLFSRMGHVLQ